MTKDEALKLAMEALDAMANEGWLLCGPEGLDNAQTKCIEAITAIKQALAQQALDRKAENARELGLDYEPEQEKTVCPFCSSEWVTAEQHDRFVDRLEQEPCCYGGIAHDCHAGDGCRIAERLKAATPPQRKPLTDEEIGAILEGVNAYGTRLYTFARAIEAAHGIKELA
jgi:hypothetical protein